MGFFTKRVKIEESVFLFFRYIPSCIQLVKEETKGTNQIPESTIANISAGQYLFFLSGLLPYNENDNIEKMFRAFQTTWALAPKVGGNEEDARFWFQHFSAGLLASDDPPNRVAITIQMVRDEFLATPNENFALDILPHTISAFVETLKKVKLV